MQALFFCPAKEESPGSQDRFWIQCRADEVEAQILVRLAARERELFEERRAEYLTTSWVGKNPGLLVKPDSFCFLVTRDGKEIRPTPPYYPYSGMWNAYCPFLRMKPVTLGSILELASLVPVTPDGVSL